MRYKGLDLNLLIALDALLTEKSVSAAAVRIFRSQPTMSSALARLREHFQDELLVQVGRRNVLTAFGESLVLPVRDILQRVDNTVDQSRKFDPATSNRSFRVCVSDFLIELVMPQVARAVADGAPRVTLELVSSSLNAAEMLENGSVDLMFGSEVSASRLFCYETLKEEEHVIIAWKGNTKLSERPTLDEFAALGRVAGRFGPKRIQGSAETMLNSLGVAQNIELTTASFVSIPHFIVGTNRIALMHRSLAEAYAHVLPLVIRPTPMPLTPLKIVLQSHGARSADAGVEWLKTIIRTASAQPRIGYADA